MVKLKKIYFVYLVVAIVVGLLAILGFFNIKSITDINLPDSSKIPFEIGFAPTYINEGTYQGYNGFQSIPINLTINGLQKNNITSIQVTDVTIERINNPTKKPGVTSISWDQRTYGNIVLNEDGYGGYLPDKTIVTGKIYACQDCFIGKDSPYQITIMIKYKQNNGEWQTPSPIKKEIKIT